MSNDKISTDGGKALGQNPFAALSGAGLPRPAPSETGNRKPETGNTRQGERKLGDTKAAPQKNRGRVDIRRDSGITASEIDRALSNGSKRDEYSQHNHQPLFHISDSIARESNPSAYLIWVLSTNRRDECTAYAESIPLACPVSFRQKKAAQKGGLERNS